MQRKQTAIDVVAGDLSGIKAIKQGLDEVAQKAQQATQAVQGVGAAAPSGRAPSADDRMAGSYVDASGRRRDARGRFIGAGGGGGSPGAGGDAGGSTGGGGRTPSGRDDRGMDRYAVGLGQLGAGGVALATSGNPAGVFSGLGALIRNPWGLGALAVGGASLFAGKSGSDEDQEVALRGYESLLGATPYRFRSGGELGFDLKTAARYGYGPSAAFSILGAYGRTSGLEDRGLGGEALFQLERTRGISSNVSGAVSSIFAAGRGGAGGGSSEAVANFFKSAIGEGLAQGLKNAHLPEYLTKVAEVSTQFARRGLDVNPLDVLGVQAGLRGVGGNLFNGTRGMDAIGAFQGAAGGIESQFANVIPPQALQQGVIASYMRQYDGDPVKALRAIQRDRANGTIMGRYAKTARAMFPGSSDMAGLAMWAQAPEALGIDQGIAAARYRGRGKVSSADLADESVLGSMAMKALETRADIERQKFNQGRKSEPTKSKAERWLQDVKGGATAIYDDLLSSVLNSPDAMSALNATTSTLGQAMGWFPMVNRFTGTTGGVNGPSFFRPWNTRAPWQAPPPLGDGPTLFRDATDPSSPTYNPMNESRNRATDPAGALLQAAQLLAEAAADFRRGRGELPPALQVGA